MCVCVCVCVWARARACGCVSKRMRACVAVYSIQYRAPDTHYDALDRDGDGGGKLKLRRAEQSEQSITINRGAKRTEGEL